MNINYVISIATAAERREHIEKEFSAQHIPFQFFNALTPSEQLTETINKILPELMQHPYQTLGEKSCFMSHILLWKKCINDNMPFITIFEDDVILGKNAHTLLTNYDWLTERFAEEAFIIKLETFSKPINTKATKIQSCSIYQFTQLDSEHVGAAGYILSQKAAKRLLSEFQKLNSEELRPIDILVFDTFLNYPFISVYQLEPALCMQLPQNEEEGGKIKSQLTHARKQNEKINPYKEKFTLWQLLIKGLTKPYRLYLKKKRKIIPLQ